MTSKAARRRAKRTRVTLPGGESAPARQGQGARNDLHPPAEVIVLEARARMLNITPAGREWLAKWEGKE